MAGFFTTLIIRDVELSSRSLLHLLRLPQVCCPLVLMCWVTLTDLHMLNQPCTKLGLKPTWSQCKMFLMCSWIQSPSILFSFFLWLQGKLAYSFLSFFFLTYLLCYQVKLALQNELGSVGGQYLSGGTNPGGIRVAKSSRNKMWASNINHLLII